MKILYPVQNGVISQRYGDNPEFYQKNFSIKFHQGVDICSSHGSPIFCSEDGFVCRIYGVDNGSITKGFGVYTLGYPDENGICRMWINWHMMSNIQVELGQEVKQGDVLGYMGDSGAVYVGGIAVPDSEKGKQPFPGTHDHWAEYKLKRTQQPPISNCFSDINGNQYRDKDGYFYEVLDYDNGVRGAVNPLLENIIYYQEWLDSKITPIIKEIPNLPEQEQKTILEIIINILKKVVSIFTKK